MADFTFLTAILSLLLAAAGLAVALAVLSRLRSMAPDLRPVETRLEILNQEVARLRDAQAGEARGQRTELREVIEGLRATIDQRLQLIQDDNAKKLEQMRQTVDEKLQGTLEKRLGESFRLVSERLEQVHKGLGEMQSLATGVGDLKKVLTNVKARGTWGEVQLGALLEQVFAPDQYQRNVAVTGTNERVEYAVKLPGGEDGPVWLPIDAKFPQEDYLRVADAAERADPIVLEAACRGLEITVRKCAKDIRDRYVLPPLTTDFAILFLPTEGLYAEVLRRPGLAESLQLEYRVMVAGPTTLLAHLTSLLVGFRTLAIQKRTGEVWKLLGDVKSEFGKFSEVLDRIRKKLQEASNTVEAAAVRTRVMSRKLREVESGESADELEAAEYEELEPKPGQTDISHFFSRR